MRGSQCSHPRCTPHLAEKAASPLRYSNPSTIRRSRTAPLPSTKTLLRYAQATGNKFHVRLSAA